MKYVDDTSICRPAFLSDVASKPTDKVNSAYEDWIQQDQMVLSWLNGFLSPVVRATIARSTSTHLTWLSLEKRYASQNQNRLLQLHGDLLQTTRSDISIADFLDKVNSLAPLLLLTLPKLALLLSVERQLQSVQLPGSNLGGTAMVVSRGRGGFHGRGSFRQRGGRGSFSSSTSWCSWCGSVFFQRCFFFFSGGASSSSMAPGVVVFPSGSRILCQICGLGSHAALDCYNRMNLALKGRLPT
ncbi:unnamed protein product, partial [Prunus brigantina]